MASYAFRKVDSEQLSSLVGYNLRRGYFIAAQLFSDVFAEMGITPIQFAILNVVGLDDSLSQKEVAANIGSSPQALVPLMRDLETRGLVSRMRSEIDRRHHHLSLTAEGETLLAELNRMVPAVEARLLRGFSDEERQLFLELLKKLVEAQVVVGE